MTPHYYDRTGERIDDDIREAGAVPPVLRTAPEWCELLRQITRDARERREEGADR